MCAPISAGEGPLCIRPENDEELRTDNRLPDVNVMARKAVVWFFQGMLCGFILLVASRIPPPLQGNHYDPADENHFTVLLPAEISPPFFAWAVTFGKGMKILGPEAVAEKMKEFLQDALDIYNDGEEK